MLDNHRYPCLNNAWPSRPKKYRDVRDFMQRNVTKSGILDNFLLVYSFARQCEHFPVYDKSMLAVYTIDSDKPGHTMIHIYHDTLGMIAQIDAKRTLPHFIATFTEAGILINPETSIY